ncbi:MAG: LysR substrate-binding domain-containing protein [Caulobacterales bacterium]|nr:LysR substrate-binding domain-containing protein [Caulobacterales bacterium]
MEYFVAVADVGAFGPAADSLSVTQPSLSKQIAVLEAELGVALFERTSRSVRLTANGVTLLAQARTTLAAARSFRAEARRLAGDTTNRLQAGVLPSIGAYFMPRLRERLQTSLPDLRVSLVEGASRELLGRLDAGELDFVVASRSDLSGFEVLPLFEETLWFCSAPGDPLMNNEGPAPLSTLAGRQLLTLAPEFYLTRIVQNLAAEAGATLNGDYRGASLDAIRQMAASGDGVAILPSLYALGEAVRDPDFKVRRIDHPEASHPVFLYWRRTTRDQGLFQRLGEEMMAEKLKIIDERAEKFQL